MRKININNIESKYIDGIVNTERLENYECFMQYYNKIYDDCRNLSFDDSIKKKQNELNCLYSVSIRELTELFGKEDFTYDGEYKYYIWTVEHNCCKALILSSKEKGTTIEILLTDTGRTNGSVENLFLSYLELIKKN
jgi:hypothetical protein